MIHLLIVDDEITTVEIIKASYDWHALGVDCVFTAYSVQQAIAVIEKHPVDILLCDIEMGIHSGLELLEWIKVNRLPIVSFVLTGYAEFDFCKQAFELGCIDYLLKPLQYEDLKKAVDTGREKLKEQNDKKQLQRQMEIIRDNTSSLNMQFWIEVVSNSVTSRQVIFEKAQKKGISILPEDRYLLILSHWFQMPSSDYLPTRERSRIRETLNSAAWENLAGLVAIIPTYINNSDYYIIRQTDDSPKEQFDSIMKGCLQMNIEAKKTLNIKCVYCIADFQQPEHVSKQFNRLYNFLRQQKDQPEGILMLNQCDDQNGQAESEEMSIKLNMSRWSLLLETGQISELQHLVNRYFDMCGEQNQLNDKMLDVFQRVFQEMIESVLNKHDLDFTRLDLELWRAVSVSKVAEQCNNILREVYQRLNMSSKSNAIVDKAKKYIKENLLNGDVTRGSIADHLGINPEYLSHIFKGQKGITLQDYIVQKKIDVACDLLKHTDLSVSEISTRLGYVNFSYFSQLFRKAMKITPTDFKKEYRNQTKV